jgi:hypothetical protein
LAILDNYLLELDQYADSSRYSWTLYPPGTLFVGLPPLQVAAAGSVPTDLSGATARMMIRSHPADPSPVVTITSTLSAFGQLVLGGVLGTIALKPITKLATGLLRAQTRGERKSNYQFQIYVDFPDSTSITAVGGNVITTLAVVY